MDNIKISIDENINVIKKDLGESTDIIIRKFLAGEKGNIVVGIIYIENLTDKMFIQDFVMKTLMLDIRKAKVNSSINLEKGVYEKLRDFSISIADIKDINNYANLYKYLLDGYTVILIDGYDKGFVANSKGYKERSIAEPSTQPSIRGPKDSFSETMQTNLSLIRRRIKDPTLRIETKIIGRSTKTEVAMIYKKGTAKNEIVNEVRTRLDQINIDGILDSGYIEELIEDKGYTPFPRIYNTERPDIVAAGILEGRIAIIVDGSPFVLLVPALFIHFFQISEDYYNRYDIGTFIRILRYFAFFISLLVPSIYIAITTHHQELIPFSLIISIAVQRNGVPFPILLETILMEITFELLREAAIRMPRTIGTAVSIVGALVLGDAAVKAGIVSPVMVVIVAITAISSLVSPSFNMAISIRLIRFSFMIISAIFGIFGIAMAVIVLVLHLCSLNSFGVPYMNSLAPYIEENQRDVIARFSWRKMKK